jgi:hypothetical protein
MLLSIKEVLEIVAPLPSRTLYGWIGTRRVVPTVAGFRAPGVGSKLDLVSTLLVIHAAVAQVEVGSASKLLKSHPIKPCGCVKCQAGNRMILDVLKTGEFDAWAEEQPRGPLRYDPDSPAGRRLMEMMGRFEKLVQRKAGGADRITEKAAK